MSKRYFEACKAVVSALDTEELASLALGDVLGRGSGFAFRQLGKLTIEPGNEQFLGIKVPTANKHAVEARLMGELAFIGLVVEMSPRLMDNVPSFMALARLEGDDILAGILTEDVSQGGKKRVREAPASNRLRKLLYEPFNDLGPIEKVMSDRVCDRSLAFNVEGTEKLLDFTPKPIHEPLLRSSASYRDAFGEAIDLIPDITITLPRSSNLGAALAQIATA